MARYTGPKDRLSRREGFDLFSKGAKLTRLAVPPGVHGPKGVFKRSQYAKQLREKQKVKRLYGILERQFKNYIKDALTYEGNTGERFVRILEKRLDNTIYRLGLAPTRMFARQIVNHGHVRVNGIKVNIPSYILKVGDTITLSDTALSMPVIKKKLQDKIVVPKWLMRKAAVSKVGAEPNIDDVPEPFSTQDIVEYYSR